MPSPEQVELATALETLRDELESAWVASQADGIRFRVGDVTLTVQAVARTENKVGGKLRWWIIEGGGEHSGGREAMQTLTLQLTPQLY